MKSRLLIPIITAATALGSGVASANASYWAKAGLLLEVSADPRDGSDMVQTNPVHADSLELVALNDNVRLTGMTVRFSDGHTFMQQMSTIRPGERVRVDLPENCGVIQSVELDYGRQLVDRTPARLQIIPHSDRASYAPPTSYSYYSAPSYTYNVQPSVPPAQPVIRDHRRWAAPAQPVYIAPQPAPQPTYVAPPPTYIAPAAPSYIVQPRPASTGWSGYIQASFRF